ncbi:MAG: GNAT family N-acetyltransferase [Blastocatellia bacterium]|nr:MAG: GNAT family N-acetyltransferase [Blastocatellia bacterium]
MIVLETDRLVLRHLDPDKDLEFVVRLLNEPSFLRYIGDKGVRTLDDARQYLLTGPVASYEKNSYGLYLMQLKHSLMPVGICGLVKRDYLPDPDIGFALLPQFWKHGYALEAATGVMRYATETLKINRVVAITEPTNETSARLLEKLGLRFERMLDETNGPVKLFTPIQNMSDKL